MAGPSTLPGSWYTDPATLDAELELAFRRSWHYAGHTGDLAASGGWLPGRAGPVPVLVTRDGVGRLRALEAVCRHQGAVINPPARAGATVRCAYHGWEYRLDGSLAAAPRYERLPGFDPGGHALPELPVGTWGPLAFVAASTEVPPLTGALGGIPDRIAAAGVDVGRLRFLHRSRSRVTANWKRGVEGALAAGARLVFPATTIELLAGRVEIGTFTPAGPEAAERLVDAFSAPAALPASGHRGGQEVAEFGRRLRDALGPR